MVVTDRFHCSCETLVCRCTQWRLCSGGAGKSPPLLPDVGKQDWDAFTFSHSFSPVDVWHPRVVEWYTHARRGLLHGLALRPALKAFVYHDDIKTWGRFPQYWSFVRGIHRSPVDFPSQRASKLVTDVFFVVNLDKHSIFMDLACCWTNVRVVSDLRCDINVKWKW